MQEKTKTATLSGQQFVIHKLPADVGSFILMKLMGETAKAAAKLTDNGRVTAEVEPEMDDSKKPSPEDRVKAMCFMVFSGELAFEDFRFMQKHCLRAVHRIEGQGLPIPVAADDGRIADPELAANHGLITQLMMEVFVFNFASFFAESTTGVVPTP